MAATGGNCPLGPHMRPFAPRRCFKRMGDNPLSLRMYFWGGLRACMALKVFLCSGNYAPPQHRSVFRAIHTLNSPAPKIISACLGGCRPSIQHLGAERNASYGALGGHFHRRRPGSAMIVLVDVGRWRLTSDLPTVGIV
jgi:hypothetical protein